MKFAIPTVDGLLCPHFGHCQRFAIIDVNTDDNSISNIETLTPPAHEPGVLPAWLGQMGCDVIISGGMGGRAQTIFNQNGIRVIVGAPSDKPETIVKAYLEGKLITGDNVCDH